jgi:hypothetical protein
MKRELTILNSTKHVFIFQLDTISSCSEPEDGEISTSGESSEDDIDDEDDFERNVEFEVERNVETVSSLNLPTPCIRIVVTESSDDSSLAVGKLFIVTCTGRLKK